MKKNYYFPLKKGVGSGVGPGVGFGSFTQRYESADPDPHQNVTDPQNWLNVVDAVL
jgi:hypothetical protein